MSDCDKAVFSKKELCIRNQELKRELGTFKSGNRTLQLRLSELKQENEQLKQQIDEMITVFENSGLDYHITDELNEILNR